MTATLPRMDWQKKAPIKYFQKKTTVFHAVLASAPREGTEGASATCRIGGSDASESMLCEGLFQNRAFGPFGLEAHHLGDRLCDASLIGFLVNDCSALDAGAENERKNFVRGF